MGLCDKTLPHSRGRSLESKSLLEILTISALLNSVLYVWLRVMEARYVLSPGGNCRLQAISNAVVSSLALGPNYQGTSDGPSSPHRETCNRRPSPLSPVHFLHEPSRSHHCSAAIIVISCLSRVTSIGSRCPDHNSSICAGSNPFCELSPPVDSQTTEASEYAKALTPLVTFRASAQPSSCTSCLVWWLRNLISASCTPILTTILDQRRTDAPA